MTQTVSTDSLAAVFGVHRENVARVFYPLNPGAKRLVYDCDRLNARLAHPAVAIGFPLDKPPTMQALLAGELTLVRAGEAIMLSPYTRHTLRTGGLPCIRLTSRMIRYSLSDISRLHAPKGLSPAQTSYIFGLKSTPQAWAKVNMAFVQCGRLAVAKTLLDRRTLVVSREDVVSLLASGLLPHWIDAEEWIAYRLSTLGTSNETALWNISTAAAALGVDHPILHSLLDDEQLDYMWTLNKKVRRITPDSVRRYLQEGPLTPGAPRPPLALQTS